MIDTIVSLLIGDKHAPSQLDLELNPEYQS